MKSKISKSITIAMIALFLPLLYTEVCSAKPIVTPGNIPMQYLPGTSEIVSNMPEPTNFVRGESHIVSSEIPERNGYEFVDWQLDYTIRDKVNLIVKCRFDHTGEEIGSPTVYGHVAYPGDIVEEKAPFVKNYVLADEETKTMVVPDGDFEMEFWYTITKLTP